MTKDKEADFKSVYQNIRLGGKEISAKISSLNRTSTESAKSSSEFSSYINLQKKSKYLKTFKNKTRIYKGRHFK